jgi:hypothetical protein
MDDLVAERCTIRGYDLGGGRPNRYLRINLGQGEVAGPDESLVQRCGHVVVGEGSPQAESRRVRQEWVSEGAAIVGGSWRDRRRERTRAPWDSEVEHGDLSPGRRPRPVTCR